jgi:hypothetical protein
MPSGVTIPAALWMRRSSSDRVLSIIPWTLVTQTYFLLACAIHEDIVSIAVPMSMALTWTPKMSLRDIIGSPDIT